MAFTRGWVEALLSDLGKQSELYILSDTNDVHWSHISNVFHHVLSEIQRPANQYLFIDDTSANTDTAQSCGFQTHHYQERSLMIAEISRHLG
ncbi:MAG: hypothetical protein AAF483_23050 [Planctomycetota bacterium]